MKLKVTKSAKKCLCEHSMMMMMDESVIVSSVICLLLCQYKSTFPPLNGPERGQMVHGGLCTVSMEVYY